jgi:hypothetical protein
MRNILQLHQREKNNKSDDTPDTSIIWHIIRSIKPGNGISFVKLIVYFVMSGLQSSQHIYYFLEEKYHTTVYYHLSREMTKSEYWLRRWYTY